MPNYPLRRTGTPQPHSCVWHYLPDDRVSDPFAPIYQYRTDTPFLGCTSAIVTQLWIIRALSMVVTFVHPDHNCCAVGINFTQCLHSDSWVLSDTTISFPSFGDSVSGSCWLIVAIHSNTETDCCVFEIKTPPQVKPKPIARYIWAPFSKPELAISYSKVDT